MRRFDIFLMLSCQLYHNFISLNFTFFLRVDIPLPTVETFFNYLPLFVGGYVIGAIHLVANAFGAVLQFRRTIEVNLKEFHGTSDQVVCKSGKEFGGCMHWGCS